MSHQNFIFHLSDIFLPLQLVRIFKPKIPIDPLTDKDDVLQHRLLKDDELLWYSDDHDTQCIHGVLKDRQNLEKKLICLAHNPEDHLNKSRINLLKEFRDRYKDTWEMVEWKKKTFYIAWKVHLMVDLAFKLIEELPPNPNPISPKKMEDDLPKPSGRRESRMDRRMVEFKSVNPKKGIINSSNPNQNNSSKSVQPKFTSNRSVKKNQTCIIKRPNKK